MLDPELRLNWPEDGSARVRDSADKDWAIFPYRGNDMALRARLQASQQELVPRAIWVRPRPMEGPDSLDLTSLADLVSLADAFVDSSVAGMLGELMPDVPLPGRLAEWAPDAASEPRGFAIALHRVLEFRGKPVSRRHVLAAAVCQASSRADEALAWLDDSDTSSLVCSYAQLLALDSTTASRRAAGEVLRYVASTLPGSSGSIKPGDAAKLLLGISPDILLLYLYLLAASVRHSVAHAGQSLVNHGLVTPELLGLLSQEPRLQPVLADAAERLMATEHGMAIVAQAVEKRLDTASFRGIQQWLAAKRAEWAEEPVAAVRLSLLASALDSEELSYLQTEATSPVGSPRYVRAVDALQRVAATISRYSALLKSMPDPDKADLAGLVDGFIQGLATVEFDLGQLRQDIKAVASILGEQQKLAGMAEGVLGQCWEMLLRYDRRLAKLLLADPGLVGAYPNALHRWLPQVVAPAWRLNGEGRLWILVFDGMRWDLWDRVLRPELEASGWQVNPSAGVALLPSETFVCRRALLGGTAPSSWGESGGVPGEDTLAKRFFEKAAGREVSLSYRLRAEDGGWGAGEDSPTGEVNIRVYGSPDHQVHQAGGSLRNVEIQFRAFLRENVLPELRSAVAHDDLVFVASDHGFLRLTGENRRLIALPPDRVGDRHLGLLPGEEASAFPGIAVGHSVLGRWQVAVEDWGYLAPGSSAPPASLRHGGASLSELVVPLVQLMSPSRPVGTVELEIEGPSDLDEDAEGEYLVRVVNSSDAPIKGQLVFESNLGAEGKLPISLDPGKKAERRRTLMAREGLDSFRVRLVAGAVTLVARSRPIRVELKPGIRLKGLDGLEDDF